MGKKILSTEAAGKLRQLTEKHAEHIMGKATIRARIEAAYESELRDMVLVKSRLANEAIALGVPKSQVSSAIGTQNWDTLTNLLSLTAGEFSEKKAERVPKFEYLRMVDRIIAEQHFIAEVRYLPTSEKMFIRGYETYFMVDPLSEPKAADAGLIERNDDRTFGKISVDDQKELLVVTGHEQIWDKYR